MKLLLIIYFLPAAISAVLTGISQTKPYPFDLFYDPGFIQRHLLPFLPVKDQLNFMLTCRHFYKFLHQDYDDFLNEITKSKLNSFEEANEEMKSEIRKLWLLFKHRHSYERFSLVHFYQIISKNYLNKSDRELEKYIYKENYLKYQNRYGRGNLIKAVNVKFDHPHFPQISLILLKAGPSKDELRELVLNACRFPQIFDSFFNYLAKNVYKVSRSSLYDRIEEEYHLKKREALALYHHNSLSFEAVIFYGFEIFSTGSLISLLAYWNLRAAGYRGYPLNLGFMIGICGLFNATLYFSYRSYNNFYPVYVGIINRYYNSQTIIVS